MTQFLLLVFAYLLGGVPFGYLMVRWKTGQDVRGMGSGNIGATNVLRTTGRTAGFATLLLDIAKGYFAVWIMGRFSNYSPGWMSAAALAVMAGHAFPVFLKFKGGKAVASFVGAFLCLTPLPLLATVPVFVITVAATRYISLSSVLGAACFPVGVWIILHPTWPVVAAAVAGGGFIVWRHKENLARVRSGTENVFSLKARPR